MIMAVILFLIIAAGIFPLAREGFFAAGSANQGICWRRRRFSPRSGQLYGRQLAVHWSRRLRR